MKSNFDEIFKKYAKEAEEATKVISERMKEEMDKFYIQTKEICKKLLKELE